MRPLIVCEWRDIPESPRVAAVIMANDLEAIARAVRIGQGGGTGRNASWVIHTDVTIDELREALALLAPKV